jgi:hypothetical protein
MDQEVRMGGDIVRGLMAGAILLLVVTVTGALGVFAVSDLAVGGVFFSLFLLLALAVFDDSWESADAPGDAVPRADPLTARWANQKGR